MRKRESQGETKKERKGNFWRPFFNCLPDSFEKEYYCDVA